MKVSNSFRAVPVRMNRHGSFFLSISHIISIPYHIHITFFITEGGEKSPVPPIFRKNLENVTFENKFSEKLRPTILQSYKLFFFSNL